MAVGMMLDYRVEAYRVDAHGGVATTKQAEIVLDTDLAGRQDAFNPAELLLASVVLKGIERVMPNLQFELRGEAARAPAGQPRNRTGPAGCAGPRFA